MTQEHRLALIIKTIHELKAGIPVSRGRMTLLLEPWPDLTALPWRGGAWAGSICFKPPPLGRACPVVTKIILAGLTTASTMWSKR